MKATEPAGVVGSKLPILLANGFAPWPLPLHIVRAQFRSHGYESHVVRFSLADMRDTVTYAKHIVRSVERAIAERGVDRLHLVGYSMGGVAALYAVKRLGLANRVATLVTAGSPLRGSTISWFGLPTLVFSRVGDQLRPDSDFLAQLHADPLPKGPRYVSIVGTHDLICPPETAALDGADEIIRLPIGHARFLVAPSVAAALVPHLA